MQHWPVSPEFRTFSSHSFTYFSFHAINILLLIYGLTATGVPLAFQYTLDIEKNKQHVRELRATPACILWSRGVTSGRYTHKEYVYIHSCVCCGALGMFNIARLCGGNSQNTFHATEEDMSWSQLRKVKFFGSCWDSISRPVHGPTRPYHFFLL